MIQLLDRLRIVFAVLGAVGVFVFEKYFKTAESLQWMKYLFMVGLHVPIIGILLSYLKSKSKVELYKLIFYTGWAFGFWIYFVYSTSLNASNLPETYKAKILLGAWVGVLVLSFFGILGLEIVLQSVGKNHFIEIRRVERSLISFISVGCLFLILVNLNFTADQMNKSFDLSYQKSSKLSESTQKMIQGLNKKVEIAAFFPKTNDVLQQVLPYLENVKKINSSQLSVQFFDKDLRPAEAEKYQVTRNGIIVFKNEGNTEKIDLGLTIAGARKTLKSLDSEFQKALLAISSEKKNIYFSQGHGEPELNSTASNADPLRSIKGIESFLKSQNFFVKKWSVNEGSMKEVPKDASALVILSPTLAFAETEVNSIKNYVRSGGKVFFAPDINLPHDDAAKIAKDRDISSDPLFEWLEEFGLKYKLGPLANEQNYVQATRSQLDLWFLFTNRFSFHDSISSLVRNDDKVAMVSFQSGFLEIQNKPKDWKIQETVFSLPDSFPDNNKNFKRDEKEAKNTYLMGVAIEKQNEHQKIVVFADGSSFSDAVLKNPGNILYFSDSIKWLAGTPQLQGQLTSEEDVRIIHSRKEDLVWFYGSVVAVPLLILLAGFFATRKRKVKEVAA